MAIAGFQFVSLAAGDGDSLFRLIVPIIIFIVYVVAAIGKARKGGEDQESEEQHQAPPPAGHERARQQPGPQTTRTPLPQRPVPHQGPARQMPPAQSRPVPRPMPQPQRPAVAPRPIPQPRSVQPERNPQQMFERVAKPIPIAKPASVGRIEQELHDKAKRAEKEPERVLHAEHVVDMALKRTIIPTAEVATVQSIGEVDLVEVQIDLRSPHKLREAIILREILGKPLALR